MGMRLSDSADAEWGRSCAMSRWTWFLVLALLNYRISSARILTNPKLAGYTIIYV